MEKPNMHILYIHQYFATPRGSTGTRSYEFARRWAQEGHKVTLLTTTAALVENDLASVRGRFIKTFSLAGFDVIALNIPYKQSMGFLRRIVAFVSFVVCASLAVLSVRKVDVVYATSTPLTVGIPALTAKWFRRKPFVFEVRDQWPAVPIEMGIIKNKILIKMLLWLERRICKSASAIVALSPGTAAGVKDALGETQKRVATIPNCSDTGLFRPDIDGSSIRREFRWEDKMVFLHAGAMGKVNGLSLVINAAQRLKDQADVHFVLMGSGSQKQVLSERIGQLGLDNIQILESKPKCELPEYIAASDVSLAILADYPILEHNSANKFFDALSAGKPVLLNYSGWQRQILEENNAGFGCELCNLDEFVEKVLYFSSHRHKLSEMGQNARRIAEEEFGRAKLSAEALEVVNSV
jgi:glycosyltransferase involved in cell wall biosynthesis